MCCAFNARTDDQLLHVLDRLPGEKPSPFGGRDQVEEQREGSGIARELPDEPGEPVRDAVTHLLKVMEATPQVLHHGQRVAS
jgi:hypothetical protein